MRSLVSGCSLAGFSKWLSGSRLAQSVCPDPSRPVGLGPEAQRQVALAEETILFMWLPESLSWFLVSLVTQRCCNEKIWERLTFPHSSGASPEEGEESIGSGHQQGVWGR